MDGVKVKQMIRRRSLHSQCNRCFFNVSLRIASIMVLPALFFHAVVFASIAAGTVDPSTAGKNDHVRWPHEESDFLPDPTITFGRLPNGFGYLLKENQRPEDRVSMHLYIRAGSLNEKNEQQGFAHFLEHMLFNGSTHFPPGELVRYFQSIGMQFGNDANAHTGFDETVYDIVLPKGDEQNLRKGLLVMADYAMGALILEEEVNRERAVILSEMRARDSAAYRTFTSTLSFELPDHIISKRLPIGKRQMIEKADRKALKQFYDEWYRPDNMVLVMVGDFSISLAKRLIQDQFTDFSPRAPAPPLPAFGTIDHEGVRFFYHYEPEVGGTTVSIEVVRSQDPVPDTRLHRQRDLLDSLADQIVQNRLDASTKVPDTPFTAATIGSGIYLNRIRYAEISADSNTANWKKTLDDLEQTLRQAAEYGFSESELNRVKKDTIKQLEDEVRKASTRNSSTLARQMIRSLSDGKVIQSPQQRRDLLVPLVTAVTLEDVHEAFVKNWSDDHRLVLVTGNADLRSSAGVAPESLIEKAYLASAQKKVFPVEGKKTVAFPYLPNPEDTGTIASRETIDDLGIVRVCLGNGIHVNVKRTDYKADEVLANMIFGQGTSMEPKSLPGLSLLAEEVIGESGLGTMDSDTLERALTGKSTYVDFRIAETHFNFFAESVTNEVELLFQLIYAHIMDPGFREDALGLVRKRMQQEYQSLTRSIEGMMRIRGMKILAGGDTRFGLPSLEKLQAISLDDIRAWILPPLQNAPLELSIAGDVDVDAVIELARRYLGALPERTGASNVSRTDLPRLPKGEFYRIDVETQIQKAMVVTAWRTDDFWDIHRTRRLSVLADLFSERLRQRIREKLGASYSPYAFNRSSRAYKGYGVFQAHINVAPAKSETIVKEVKAIAHDLAHNEISDDELARVIDPLLTSIKSLRQTNGYWLNSVMTGSGRHPQQFSWARSFVDDYAAVTATDLSDLAGKYFVDGQASTIVLLPGQEGKEKNTPEAGKALAEPKG